MKSSLFILLMLNDVDQKIVNRFKKIFVEPVFKGD